MKQDKAWGSSAAQISMPRARGRGRLSGHKESGKQSLGQDREGPGLSSRAALCPSPAQTPSARMLQVVDHKSLDSRCVQVGPTGTLGEGKQPAKLSQHHSTAAVSPVQALVRASRWPLAYIRQKLCQHHRQAPVVTLWKAVSPQHLINNQALRVGVRTQ